MGDLEQDRQNAIAAGGFPGGVPAAQTIGTKLVDVTELLEETLQRAKRREQLAQRHAESKRAAIESKNQHGLKDSMAGKDTAEKRRKTDQEVRIEKTMTALASVMQQTDRIMTGKPLNVKLDVSLQGLESTPAWTDGVTISLNRSMLESLFQNGVDGRVLSKAITTFKGTNYHEVAHVMFTPGSESSFIRAIRSGFGLWYPFMALEDQRIETMYTSLYRSTSSYFIQAACQWLLFDVNSYAGVYPLIAGRKYLPVELRAEARRQFIDLADATTASRLESIVNEYIKLPLPLQWERGVVLVKEFTALMRNCGLITADNAKSTPCGDAKRGTSLPTSDDNFAPDEVAKASVRVADAVEKEEEAIANGEWDADTADGDDDSSDPGDADGEEGDDGDFGSDGPDATHGSKQADDGGAESYAPGGVDNGDAGETSDGTSSGSSRGGDETPPPANPEQLFRDALERAMVDTVLDETHQQDIEETAKSIMAQVNEHFDNGSGYEQFQEMPASTDSTTVTSRIVEKLQALRTDLEPAWIRDSPVGRVDVSRVIRRRADPSIVDIFDQWDEGSEEDAETEVVIMVDLSGSMRSIMQKVSESLWILKRSFDRAEVTTTVLGFSDGNVTLYKPNERAHSGNFRSFGVWGGTDPLKTLIAAHKILSTSSASNLVLIAITDGAWSGDAQKMEAIVSSMRKLGTSTTLFTFESAGYTVTANGTHNFENSLVIESPTQIVTVVDKMIEQIVKRALAR